MRIDVLDARFWKNVVDKSLAAIYITDEDGKIVYINDIVERATEYSKEEIYSLDSIFELAHPEDKKNLLELFEKLPEIGSTGFYEARYITKSGRVRWVWGFIVSVDFSGKRFYIGNWVDVTRAKKLEQKLKESEEFYKTLVEDSLTPVYMVQDEKLVYVNKAFEESTGYKKEEIIGKNPFFIIHPEDREIVYRRYIQREEGLRKDIETYSWRIITKNGEVRWVTARPGRVTYKGKPAVAATAIDTTEIHRLNEELKKKGEYLTFLNKIMRHDIANALTAIRGALEIIKEMPEESDRVISLAMNRIDYTAKLIDDVRALEKALEELKPVDVAELVREVAEIYKDAVVELNLESVNVMANEGLRTVVNNIIHNAIVHGGREDVQIRIETFSDGNYGVIKISDNGVGISDEIKGRIFEEGFTTGNGTGLGLYITKKILEVYNGEIVVNDNEPRGAVFEIKIPKVKNFRAVNSKPRLDKP